MQVAHNWLLLGVRSSGHCIMRYSAMPQRMIVARGSVRMDGAEAHHVPVSGEKAFGASFAEN